jgi:hypothetical protein
MALAVSFDNTIISEFDVEAYDAFDAEALHFSDFENAIKSLPSLSVTKANILRAISPSRYGRIDSEAFDIMDVVY